MQSNRSFTFWGVLKMSDTKEKILQTALRLFAQDGYEAVSMSKIAGELSITKGALYRHYKNKRDIFDTIFERLCHLDIERSKKAGVPEKEFDEASQLFRNTSAESVKAYMQSQFEYWANDEFACNFRKMLTLEQYRNTDATNLYQKVLGSGPVDFLEDLFREMMKAGTWRKGDPKQMSVELYAPFHLLLSISDATPDKVAKEKLADIFTAHIDGFIEKYAASSLQKDGDIQG